MYVRVCLPGSKTRRVALAGLRLHPDREDAFAASLSTGASRSTSNLRVTLRAGSRSASFTSTNISLACTRFEDTELGVFVEPEVGHGEAEVYARVQA